MQTTQRLFTNYISAGVQASLDRVRAAEYIVPEADRQQAWHILSFALDAPTAWQVTRELLLALAPKMEQAGFREEWIPYLEKGIKQAIAQGDPSIVIEGRLYLGQIYQFLGQFESAFQYLYAGLENASAQNDRRNQARLLNQLAWLHHLQEQPDQAVHFVEQAFTLLDKADSERGMSYRVMGMIATNRWHWEEAETYHRQALTFFEDTTDQRKLAWSLQNLGYALNGQNKFQEAIGYFDQAITILSKIGDTYHRAVVQMNLGIAYYQRNELTAAHTNYSQAESIFRLLHDKLNLARINTNLGLYYWSMGDHLQAEKTFTQSAQLHDELGNHHLRINALDGLALVYIDSGHPAKALPILEQALADLLQLPKIPIYYHLINSLQEHINRAKQS